MAVTPSARDEWALAADIGGTFTDVVLARAGGRVWVAKTLTTPDDPADGLITGVEQVLAASSAEPGAIGRVVHGTTLATNVILERRGVPVAYVTTEGFGSMLVLGRQARVEEERYDLFFEAGEPSVPRTRIFEVTERMLASGQVLVPLDEESVREAARRIAGLDVAAVAICLLHSYANPAHEERVAALLREMLPESMSVVASSEIWPEIREYERATTTVMSAYVGPVMSTYLRALRDRLAAIGIMAPVHVMESSGGVMSAELAARRAVHTIESGPAAGVVAAQHVGEQRGLSRIISFDMGGTTAKAGVIRDGKPDVTHQFHVGGKGSFGGRRSGTGTPIKVPSIDLAEVGSGGGSIAWLDPAGALRVGPNSAGADPGPACYALGGTAPTVTDADLVLGYVAPGFRGSNLALHVDRAEEALEREIAKPLGVDVVAAAHAVFEIANANMGAAVHVVTVQRGIDPREFAIVALGGAGPVHVARIAEQFGIASVIVPAHSGVGSAIGLLATDLTTERARTKVAMGGAADPVEIEGLLQSLAAAAIDDLAADGSHPDDVVIERAVDVRYRGQGHELTVPLPVGPLGAADLDATVQAFYGRYHDAYGIDLSDPVELVTWRVRVTRRVQSGHGFGVANGDAAEAEAVASRPAYFREMADFVDTPVYERGALRAGHTVAGPAIVQEADSTLVVPPGWRATVDDRHDIVLTPLP
jgi:N-methylhydantoinase A